MNNPFGSSNTYPAGGGGPGRDMSGLELFLYMILLLLPIYALVGLFFVVAYAGCRWLPL